MADCLKGGMFIEEKTSLAKVKPKQLLKSLLSLELKELVLSLTIEMACSIEIILSLYLIKYNDKKYDKQEL